MRGCRYRFQKQVVDGRCDIMCFPSCERREVGVDLNQIDLNQIDLNHELHFSLRVVWSKIVSIEWVVVVGFLVEFFCGFRHSAMHRFDGRMVGIRFLDHEKFKNHDGCRWQQQ